MTIPQAQQLERLASDLHAVAFDFAEPPRSVREVERRTEEVERIAGELRAVVRGRGHEGRGLLT